MSYQRLLAHIDRFILKRRIARAAEILEAEFASMKSHGVRVECWSRRLAELKDDLASIDRVEKRHHLGALPPVFRGEQPAILRARQRTLAPIGNLEPAPGITRRAAGRLVAVRGVRQ